MRTLFVMLLAGCQCAAPVEPTAEIPAAALAIGVSECDACGMVVREQPAPRGQLLHRDGTRRYFCSLGDMVQYLRAPSPHGKVTATWVEVLDPAVDPKQTNSAARPWVTAKSASYVIGVPRAGIMGPPVLAYPSAEIAADVARRYEGKVQTWQGLQALSAAPHLGH